MRSFYFLRAFVCSFLFLALTSSNSFGQTLSGTYTVPGLVAGIQVNNLTDLANLLDTGPATVNGTAIFEFTSSYTDTFEIYPIFFIPVNGTGNIIIRPAASVISPLITLGHTSGTALVDIHGITNLTIDGRPGGAGSNVEWLFQNSTSNTTVPTFQFINGAVHDTLEYIGIQASGTSSTSTVTFGTSTVASGNSNNVIQYCNIGNYGAFPYQQIYSFGTKVNPNSGNKILNNNIYNFQGYNTYVNGGIAVTDSGNGGNWVISGNSFYATSIISPFGNPMTVIYFAPGATSTGNIISGNYIGGRLPLCGGSRMSFRGSAPYSWPDFQGIYVNAGGTTQVSNNTIQNIRLDSSGYSPKFVGINILNGNANVTGNIVGSATDTNSIHNGGLGVIVGIWNQSTDTVTINGNTVANFTVDNMYPPTSWTYADVIGIYVYNSGIVGPTTVINNKVFGLSTTNTDNYNTINFPINNGGGSNTGVLFGIGTNSYDLMAGICLQSSGSSNQVISENQVYNIELNAVGVSSTDYIFGITAYAGAGTNTINGNKVYSIWVPDGFGNNNYFAGITGIYIPSSAYGKYNITNNMVTLGFKPNGTAVQNAWISGIWDNTQTPNQAPSYLILHIYHNSVYIGGADVNSKSNNLNSYCFRRDLDYGTFSPAVYDSVDLFNNIFFNARTTTSTIAKNYDIYLNSSADVLSNYNELYGTGSTFELGFSGTTGTNSPTLINWRTTNSMDANSISSDPLYVGPTTNPPDLHVQLTSPIDAKGTATATIVYDIDSFVRANYTPVDIGAAVINNCVSMVTPSVTLTPSANNICHGTNVIFTADSSNAGALPTYNFYLDGASVQNTTSNTYSNSNLNNNDSIRVVMTSNASCVTTTTAAASVTITVKPVTTSSITQTICQGKSFNGHTTTGNFIDTLIGSNGCDSIRTTHLTVTPGVTSSITQSICPGQSFGGHNTTGTFIDTLLTAGGCDSIRTLHLTVNPYIASTVTQTICPGQSFDGHNATGTYSDTLPATAGCDTVRMLHLTVNPYTNTSVTQSICHGQSLGGHNATGTYTDTLNATSGCDTIRTLHLTVNYLTSTVPASICSGQSYDGHNATGTYVDTIKTGAGCDSIRTLNLTVQSTIKDTVTKSICGGNSYGGHNKNGTYIDTFISVGGCDSIRILNLTVLPVSTSSITQTICQGQSYGGHSSNGTFTDTLQAANGCDSIRTLMLTVLPVSSTSITQNICQGSSYGGHNSTGTFADTLKAVNGCDSIRTLHLTVLPISTSNQSKTICQGQSYGGHSTTGIYVDTLQATNGCDSIRTLNLTVQGVIKDTVIKNICTGNNYAGHNQTGTFIDTFQSIGGCDSIRTLELTVYPKHDTSLVKTICQGERYGGHTSSGIFTDTLQSQYGCDSVRTVILTVNPVSTTTISTHICQGQSYNGHTTSGNYIDTLGAANGCDSIVTLTLSVQTHITTTIDDSICAGSNYFGYTQSGSYKDTFTAVGGCDSIRTLNLLVFPLIKNTVTNAICSGTSYGGHDTAGTYIDTLQAANGCDSIRTLYLSILPISRGINKIQLCPGDSFEGHHTGGVFEDTLMAANGCDSIVTLEISVLTPVIPTISRDGDTLISSLENHYQWFRSSNKLIDETSRQFVATQDGYYSVLVTDSNNCSITSATDTFYMLGITQVNGNRFWKIFPNPASENINIELSDIEQGQQLSLRIFDVTGKMEMDQTLTPSGKNYSEQVNLSAFAEGLYLVQIRQGDWSVSQRIVISR